MLSTWLPSLLPPLYNIHVSRYSMQNNEVLYIDLKKNIESVIMIIAGRGGGGGGFAGGDHTPLGFSSILQTQLFGSIKPQNKLCIKLEVSTLDYFQYK